MSHCMRSILFSENSFSDCYVYFCPFQFLEVENRCIMASLPYLLADKQGGAQISAGSFWKRAKVSEQQSQTDDPKS